MKTEQTTKLQELSSEPMTNEPNPALSKNRKLIMKARMETEHEPDRSIRNADVQRHRFV